MNEWLNWIWLCIHGDKKKVQHNASGRSRRVPMIYLCAASRKKLNSYCGMAVIIVNSCKHPKVDRLLFIAISISGPPSPHTNTALYWFSQKPLPRHQIPLLPQLELEVPPHSRYNKRQFHLRDIPPNTRSRSIAERNESRLLLLSQVFRIPTVRVKDVGIEAWIVGRVPDRRKMVDRVGRDREDGALGKMVIED